MPSFEIPDNPVRIDLRRDPGGTAPLIGTAVYTVTNHGPAPGGRLSVQVKSGAKPEWFAIKGDKERTFGIGETQTIEVAITVPPATPPGDYGFRLRVVSVKDTDNDHTESAASTLTVTAGDRASQPFPWWILVVGLILILAIGALLVTAYVTPGFLVARDKPAPQSTPRPGAALQVPTNCRLTYAADGGAKRRFLMDGPPIDRLRTGDFDGDGITDLLTAVPDGHGSFQWFYASGGKAPFKPIGKGPDLPDVHLGDFDGDGITDILFQKPTSGSEFDWLYSPGGVKAPVHLRYGGDLAKTAVGDFDGDGTDDLLGDQLRPDGLFQWVMYKSGRGDPQPRAYAESMTGLWFADVDNDGKTDALAERPDGTQWQWISSSAALGGYQVIQTGAPSLKEVALADVDGDGYTDMVSGTPIAGGGFQWSYWPRNPALTGPVPLATGPAPTSLLFGNFDADGKADFLMAICS